MTKNISPQLLGTLTLLSTCAVLTTATIVHARGFRPGLMPNGWTNACSNCHVDPGGGGDLNPFGSDVRTRVTRGGSEPFWSPELAALDSDGDGRTNGEELGDPAGLWSQGDPDPASPEQISNPGIRDSANPPVDPPSTLFLRGDTDGSGEINLSDAVAVFGHLFRGSDAPACLDAADSNADGSLNLSDGIFTLNYLFAGGASPASPFPECGAAADPGLGCESATFCSAGPPPPPGTGRRVELEAIVESSGDGRIGILGLLVVVPDSLRIEDDSREGAGSITVDDLRPGDFLEIRGVHSAAGTVQATRIERDDPEGRVSLLGPANFAEDDALAILGIEIVILETTRFEDLDRGALTREEFLRRARESDLLVEAKGSFVDGAIIALELELENEFDD